MKQVPLLDGIASTSSSPVSPLSRSASVSLSRPVSASLSRSTSVRSSRSGRTSSPTTSAKHLSHGCECRTVEAPRYSVATVLQEGNIPVLRIEATATDKLGLRAKRADAKTKYVVVLPAVANDLASSDYNSITTCQLIRLADRMGKLQFEEVRGELCFWTPALCVPAGSNGRLLPYISEVFRNAYATIIFDLRLDRYALAGHAAAQAYLSSLMEAHHMLGLSSRILLSAGRNFIDLRAAGQSQQAGGRTSIRTAEDYELWE